jgi:pilus assembly protein CpaF
LLDGRPVDVDAVRHAARVTGFVVDEQSIASLSSALSADLRGFGPLEPFLADPRVTDIVVNGAREVWVDRGDGMAVTTVQFRDDMSVRRMAQRLATSCGRRLDDACPFVDAPLADGIRLHAMVPPLVDRVSMSIRVPRHRAWTLRDLTASGMVCPDASRLLRDLLQQRSAFLITGGTGSGKTTLLNALLGLVSPTERLVIVEDTRELAPQHPHVVRLQTRAPNIEGAGGVTMQDLVRQTLRMRPDRIVVGEVRGAEVIDLLTAFNTGHRGGCSTVHANSAGEVVARLEALGALANLSRTGVQRLLAAAIDAVVHLRRDADGRRRVTSMAVVVPDQGGVRIESAFTFSASGEMHEQPGADLWRSLLSPE